MPTETELTTRIADWFSRRLPASWSSGPAQIEVDRDEVMVVLPQADATGSADFRQASREERMALARAAQETFARTVSWGVLQQGVARLFTTVRTPVTAELAMPERRVLDTLTESGVATDRSDAVAWCIRLVAQHEGDWLGDLHDAAASAGTRPEPRTEF
jgi:hypothetical protein